MTFLQARAVDAVEEMDLPGCDPDLLERTYTQFALVNRAVSGWHGIYRARIRPRLSPGTITTLLDIGCGGGDVPVMIARWAARDGLRLEITAIDPDARASRFARARKNSAGVIFRQSTAAELAAEGRQYDVVISNHVLHHLGETELPEFLAESASLARWQVIHNDLRRSPTAYVLFHIFARIFTGSFIRQDGLTSIRRSYTPGELAAAAPPGWTVAPHSPFHHLLLHRVRAGTADG
ncbi:MULTISPECIES: class I SAM-dependent methyltransferase [Arthrobacter]|uniref:Methyltransferase domain-containing protein n=1 Tax=Arthrobacter oryzae TaxID=409290 RepID=A0A3N0CKB6_9MICC|nr:MULTISPECIES: class I SAM-dependent methyltransferase [Arthrobacter]QYF90309.1 methyltransferase domain-containing protein [Arthrobacter sp. PAMC25284]RNL63898.1 methyltransferase domain-containing protein [Arthrobacter oryzae]